MKRKIIFFSLILLVVILAIFFYKKDYFFNEEPKISYELIKGKKIKGKIYFKYVVHNEGNKNAKIIFLSPVEMDYSVLKTDDSSDKVDSNENLKNNNSESKEGRTISLGPGEELKKDIVINSDEYSKGNYILSARLATENINTPLLTANFKID
ncbi:hypothetical protein J6TS2_11820 [Heyndrickxia sporothermodurans]|nr:hypothetical protein J6TS2_11820 [Heyndrickxia sporothermodurans]